MTSQRITVGPRTLQEMAAFEQEINAVKAEVRQRVGDKDARYIRTILWTVRILEISGRGLLMLGWFPPTWLLGTFLLGGIIGALGYGWIGFAFSLPLAAILLGLALL